jgi:signal transduction histidine kinase
MSGETPRQNDHKERWQVCEPHQVATFLTTGAERSKAEHDLREELERLQCWNIELEQALSEKTAELRQSQGRLRALVSELSLAEQRERKRLANELHDHLQQILVLGKLMIGQGKRLGSGVPDCQIVF